jgi:protein disulfide-isomerase-like protein
LVNFAKGKADPSFVPEVEPFKNVREWDGDSGEVAFLTDEHFDSYRADQASHNNGNMLVMFYAPWCGHCKAMKPDFGRASVELKDDAVTLAAVDCTEHKDVCAKYGVDGYPTLKYFDSPDGPSKDYTGGRAVADLVKFGREGILADGGGGLQASDLSYSERLTAIYEKHNKDKLSTVQATLAKYKGREVYLFQLLKEKYGAEPIPQKKEKKEKKEKKAEVDEAIEEDERNDDDKEKTDGGVGVITEEEKDEL